MTLPPRSESPPVGRASRRLSGRWAAARRQPGVGPELGQAGVRIVVSSLAMAYVTANLFAAGSLDTSQVVTLWIFGAFLLASAGIFTAVLTRPSVSVPRRVLGIVVDNVGITLVLLLNGTMAAPLFVLYLWVTFGNGFRFGLPYLATSAVLGLVGFTVATLAHEQWRTEAYWVGAIFVGLIILPAYAGALLRDLRRALRRAEAASEAKSQFMANISHEIRTPLHGILGLNELLMGSGLPEWQQRLAELTRQSATWLLETVNHVLDFSKIEAGGLELERRPFDLKRVVTDVVALHREPARSKPVSVSCVLDDRLPDHVLGDPLRVAQVLNNLVGNAVKFTEIGAVVVRVHCAPGGTDELGVAFEVADTGIGIAPEALRRLFEPFFQADASTTRRVTGTGLGLAITRGLVEGMGGTIDVASAPGEGSTFSFTVPFGRVPERGAADITPDAPSPPARPRTLSARVLAVEDNPVYRELIERFLKGFGCDVGTACTGREAVEARWTDRWDLVLMDCQMPDMDGYEAARRIRAAEASAGAARVPIIALTAHAGASDRERCMDAGMDDYVSKPFAMADLRSVLERWLPAGDGDHPAPAGTVPTVGASPAIDVPARSDVAAPPPNAADAPFGRKAVHDLNNLLMAVIGNAELLLEILPEDAEQRHQVEQILTAARGATDLVASERRRARALTPPS